MSVLLYSNVQVCGEHIAVWSKHSEGVESTAEPAIALRRLSTLLRLELIANRSWRNRGRAQGSFWTKPIGKTSAQLINYCFRKVLLHQLFNQQSDLFNINFALSILRVMSFVFVLSVSVRRLIWKDLFWHLPWIAIKGTSICYIFQAKYNSHVKPFQVLRHFVSV